MQNFLKKEDIFNPSFFPKREFPNKSNGAPLTIPKVLNYPQNYYKREENR